MKTDIENVSSSRWAEDSAAVVLQPAVLGISVLHNALRLLQILILYGLEKRGRSYFGVLIRDRIVRAQFLEAGVLLLGRFGNGKPLDVSSQSIGFRYAMVCFLA